MRHFCGTYANNSDTDQTPQNTGGKGVDLPDNLQLYYNVGMKVNQLYQHYTRHRRYQLRHCVQVARILTLANVVYVVYWSCFNASLL